jgi:predicted dehydrogenase
MSKRAVVVGAGGISGAWFPPLKAEGVDVAGIVDLDEARARSQAQKHGLDAFISTDLPATLRKVKPDFVVDLTVPGAHCSVTCTALRMGCPVIGEKPMAASMAQARRMVRTAEAAGKLYMVSQSRRYDARHAGIARFIGGDGLGALTTINCAFYIGAHFGGFRDAMPHPLILDMAIHHFDLARMFSRADPVSVYAQAFNPRGSWYKGDAAASCIFEMSDGLVFTYTGSWCAEGMHTSWHGDWRLVGEQGSMVYERDQPPVGERVTGDTGFHRTKSSCDVNPVETPEGQRGAIREFLAALNGGPAPQGECHDNIKSLAMVFGAIESARRGRRVVIRT